jgi:hypothetical protein
VAAEQAKTLNADNRKILRAFCRAYLHQDFKLTHRSARAAARAAPDQAKLAAAWKNLVQAVPKGDLDRARQFLVDDLGAAWNPRNWEDFRDLFKQA